MSDQWRVCFRFVDGAAYNVEVCDGHQAGVLHISIPISRTMKRRLTHPGEMLREDFVPDYAITVAGLAEALGGPSRDARDPRVQ